MWIVSHKQNGKCEIETFSTIDGLFEWLQSYYGTHGNYPSKMVIFKGQCVFDGS
jgi:hypothetical protein